MKIKNLLMVLAAGTLMLTACGGSSSAEKRYAFNPDVENLDEKGQEDLSKQLASYVTPVLEALKTAKGLELDLGVKEDANLSFDVAAGEITASGELKANKLEGNLSLAVGGFDLVDLGTALSDLDNFTVAIQASANGGIEFHRDIGFPLDYEDYIGPIADQIPEFNVDLNGFKCAAYLNNSTLYADLSNEKLRSNIADLLPEELATAYNELDQSKFKYALPDGISLEGLLEDGTIGTVISALPLVKYISEDSLATFIGQGLSSLKESEDALNVYKALVDAGLKMYTYPEKSEKNFTFEFAIDGLDDIETLYNKFLGQEEIDLDTLVQRYGVTVSKLQITLSLNLLKSGGVELVLANDISANVNYSQEANEEGQAAISAKASIKSKGELSVGLEFLATAPALPTDLASYEVPNDKTMAFVQQVFEYASEKVQPFIPDYDDGEEDIETQLSDFLFLFTDADDSSLENLQVQYVVSEGEESDQGELDIALVDGEWVCEGENLVYSEYVEQFVEMDPQTLVSGIILMLSDEQGDELELEVEVFPDQYSIQLIARGIDDEGNLIDSTITIFFDHNFGRVAQVILDRTYYKDAAGEEVDGSIGGYFIFNWNVDDAE